MLKPLVRITWIDAEDYTESPWASEAETEEFANALCHIHSVGFLVSKTAKYASLAGDWDESSKNYGRLTKIPVAWIVELVELHPQLPSDSAEQKTPPQ